MAEIINWATEQEQDDGFFLMTISGGYSLNRIYAALDIIYLPE